MMMAVDVVVAKGCISCELAMVWCADKTDKRERRWGERERMRVRELLA